MENGPFIFILVLVAFVYFIMYYDSAIKYTKLEENFGGFMNKSLVRVEFEKSPLHTIVYGAAGTGKTYFFRQHSKLYLDPNQDQNRNQDQNQNQNQNQDQKPMMGQEQKQIIIVCKDEKDWIDPKTGAPYAGFEMGDINMITLKNLLKFENSLIVLDDMGDKFNKDIVDYFTEGRNKNIQMIVMCHKPAQIDIMARMNCATFFI